MESQLLAELCDTILVKFRSGALSVATQADVSEACE
jgi:hypothetical protein